jgi:enoyl-CoA hydratase/carnithine racemase
MAFPSHDLAELLLAPHPRNNEFQYLEVSSYCSSGAKNSSCKVVCVGLNRPNKRNALNRDLWVEIGRFFSTLHDDDDGSCPRAVLLYGIGDAFCSGIDLSEDAGKFMPTEKRDDDGGVVDVAHRGISFIPKLRQMQDCFTALERCNVPVIAAVHGACIGAGVDLVCAADIVWCTATAVFSIREVQLGLAADVGTLQRLPKRTGNHSLVRELCFTGRNFDASEALRMGLVGRICADRKQLMSECMLLCQSIAEHSPVAVRGTKQAILYARDRPVQDGLDQVALYNALALQGRDVRIAMKSRAAATAGGRKKSRQETAAELRVPEFSDLPPRSKL